MKKFVPIALLLCVLFSMSSFTPPKKHSSLLTGSGKFAISFPITGTTLGRPGAGQPRTTINYQIDGSSSTPNIITFSYMGNPVGTNYQFFVESVSGSTTSYIADGMESETGIAAVRFIRTGDSNYSVEFIRGL